MLAFEGHHHTTLSCQVACLLFSCLRSFSYIMTHCISDHLDSVSPSFSSSGWTFIGRKMQVQQKSPSPSTQLRRAAPLLVACSWTSCRRRPTRPRRESILPQVFTNVNIKHTQISFNLPAHILISEYIPLL